MMTFGKQLREARRAMGYTQKELAVLINAKHNSVSNWENDQNKPDPDTIELICGALNITPSHLMGWEDIIESNSEGAKAGKLAAEMAKDKDAQRLLKYYLKLSDINKKMALGAIEALAKSEKEEQ